MPRTNRNMADTPAADIVRAFQQVGPALARLLRNIPDRITIDTVSKGGEFRGDGLVVLDEIMQHLAGTGLIFRHNDDVVMTDRGNSKLLLLATDGIAEVKAAARLGNLIACVRQQVDKKSGEIERWEFQLPNAVCDQLFAHERCLERLPEIKVFARHPVFDEEFRLLGPGYHPDANTLVQGQEITPATESLPELPPASRRTISGTAEALRRLTPHLRELLCDFDWRSHVDLVNAIGSMLMGFCIHHFIDDGHPMVVIRGNQPSIGKSLLAKIIGMIFDNRKIPAIKKSGDEEFDKLLCAMLKKRRRVVFLDNLRGRLDSERIEQLVTSPTIMLRILGVNEFGEWPNDVLFLATSNNMVAGRDLISRNLIVNLYTEGDPRVRHRERQHRRPLDYARRHRKEILGELAAMVMRWIDAGRPEGDINTRFEHVSQIIGGILDANGLPGFASNAEEAAAEMDDELMKLTDLAEAIAAGQLSHLAWRGDGDAPRECGGDAKQWIAPLEQFKIVDPDPGSSARSRSCAAGRVLSAMVGRTIRVEGAAGGTVTIQKRELGGNRRLYVAVVRTGDAAADPGDRGGDDDGDSQTVRRDGSGQSSQPGQEVGPVPAVDAAAALESPPRCSPRGTPPGEGGWLRRVPRDSSATSPAAGGTGGR